eukprot:s472_g19.t1
MSTSSFGLCMGTLRPGPPDSRRSGNATNAGCQVVEFAFPAGRFVGQGGRFERRPTCLEMVAKRQGPLKSTNQSEEAGFVLSYRMLSKANVALCLMRSATRLTQQEHMLRVCSNHCWEHPTEWLLCRINSVSRELWIALRTAAALCFVIDIENGLLHVPEVPSFRSRSCEETHRISESLRSPHIARGRCQAPELLSLCEFSVGSGCRCRGCLNVAMCCLELVLARSKYVTRGTNVSEGHWSENEHSLAKTAVLFGAKPPAQREVLERCEGRPAPPSPEEQEPEDPAERPCKCYEQTPPKLALQKGRDFRDCGSCSANLGRRLDLLEARVLSHWHEFLVHKSEVQRKFEDVFAACRGHRPKGAMAAHADLERRLSFCEGVVRDSEDERAKHLELKVLSEDTWRGLERLQNRVAQESDNLGKVSADLQRRLAVLDKKSDELQLGLQSQVADLRREMQDVIVRASKELGVELRSSFERRIRQGHDEALESAEIASQRCMKSAMSEMNASVMTAEARAQQQCARLRGELEVAEAAAEDIWRRSSSEIARAVAASETSLKPRLQQIDEDARAAMTSLELSLERRLLQHSSEAAENLRSLDTRAQQNMAEVAESITHVEQLLRSQRSEALASLEALDSRLATQSRRCTDSEAREASLERRLQKEHVQLADDMHTNMLQVRRELADRTGTMESRVITEVAGLRDELKDSIAAGLEI